MIDKEKAKKVFIRFYASRIKYKRMTLDEVPAKYKEAVAEFMMTEEYFKM